MKKKFLKIQVEPHQLTFGKKHGVTRKEAETSFIEGFMKEARKHKDMTYKGYAGIEFEFY